MSEALPLSPTRRFTLHTTIQQFYTASKQRPTHYGRLNYQHTSQLFLRTPLHLTRRALLQTLSLYASPGSPVYSTFLRAIRAGYLSSWPRLTTSIVLAHSPHAIATDKGHLNQLRQVLDSTKTKSVSSTIDEDDSLELPLIAESANHACVKLVRFPHTVSSDSTGKFLFRLTVAHSTFSLRK